MIVCDVDVDDNNSLNTDYNNDLLSDFFNFLYSCAAMLPIAPTTPKIYNAFMNFFMAFSWLHKIDSINYSNNTISQNDTDLFIWLANIHEKIAPDVFDGPSLVLKYTQDELPPSTWGPPAWRLLHALAGRKEEHPNIVRDVLHSLTIILPCPACREHLPDRILNEPVPSASSELSTYLISLHTHINLLRDSVVI